MSNRWQEKSPQKQLLHFYLYTKEMQMPCSSGIPGNTSSLFRWHDCSKGKLQNTSQPKHSILLVSGHAGMIMNMFIIYVIPPQLK